MFLNKPNSVFKKMHEALLKDSIYGALMEQKADLERSREDSVEARKLVKEAFRRGTYTQDELSEELAKVDDEMRKIDVELASVNAQLTLEENKEAKIMSITAMAKKFKEHFKAPSYAAKMEVLQAVVEQIVLDGEEMKLVLKVPKSIQEELNKWEYPYGATGQD